MSAAPCRVALVTGGSRGIGLASARKLAPDHAAVVLAARDRASLDDASGALRQACPQADVSIFSADVAEEADVKALFREIHSRYGRLDTLVNSAGIFHEAPLLMTRTTDLQRTFAVNVFGSYLCCKQAAQLMARNRQGAIVNLASVAGQQGVAGQSVYAASKGAIAGLTRSLARELGSHGIRVNAVAPGLIDTEMTAAYRGERGRRVIVRTALQRIGDADEVGALVAFLASSQAAYITGQILAIDGGLSP